MTDQTTSKGLPMQVWEEVPNDREPYLCRLNVPGGWLVMTVCDTENFDGENRPTNTSYNSSICFMPDPEHIWLSTANS